MNKLPRCTPVEAGVHPKTILKLIDKLEEKKTGIQSMMLVRRGKVFAEGWWAPYKPEYNHSLYSLSKSFTSTAVGFAVQEGLLSVEDKVLSFFPDKLTCAPCDNMRLMTVKNLLTMGTGHTIEPEVFYGEDMVYNFLQSYVQAEPGTVFVYNTPATYMLSAIVQKVTGMCVRDYLEPRLFKPLGITDIYWDKCPKGINMGGFGLNVKTEDIAKFGTFILNKGVYNGERLLNAEWIEKATSKQISNGDPANPSDWSQGYGYQFWRCQPTGVFRGDGAFGQLCIVDPAKELVIAVTAGSTDIQTELKQFWDELLPNIDNIGDACPDCLAQAQKELDERLASLSLKTIGGCWESDIIPSINGIEYELSHNRLTMSSLTFCTENGVQSLKTIINNQPYIFKLGFGKWEKSINIQSANPDTASLTSDISYSDSDISYAAAGWDNNVLTCDIVFVKTPFLHRIVIDFRGDCIRMTAKQNAAFGGGGEVTLGIKK